MNVAADTRIVDTAIETWIEATAAQNGVSVEWARSAFLTLVDEYWASIGSPDTAFMPPKAKVMQLMMITVANPPDSPSQQRLKAMASQDQVVVVPDTAQSVEQDLVHGRALEVAFGLPAIQRRYFELFLQGVNPIEIARQQNSTLNEVNEILRMAFRYIRSAITSE